MTGLFTLLVDAAAKGAVVLVGTVLLVGLLRRSSAAVRHFVWGSGVMAAGCLPALCLVLPGWAVLPMDGVSTGRAMEDGSAAVPFRAEVVRREGGGATSPRQRPRGSPEGREDPAARRKAAVPAGPSNGATGMEGLAAWGPWIWAVGAVASLCPLIAGVLSLARLRRASTTVTDPWWVGMLRRVEADLGLRRPVRLLSSPIRDSPVTWGGWPFGGGTIVLPEEAGTWSSARRRAVLVHEAAHLKRCDPATQILARVACGLHWFNPLVWIAATWMVTERERACDDVVLRDGTEPPEYARHLVEVAAGPRAGRFAALLGAPMVRSGDLEGRVRVLLDRHRDRRPPRRWARTQVVALVAGTSIPLAMVEPAASTMQEAEPRDRQTAETSGPEDAARAEEAQTPWWRREVERPELASVDALIAGNAGAEEEMPQSGRTGGAVYCTVCRARTLLVAR